MKYIFFCTVIISILGCQHNPQKELILFAGVGMTDVVKEIATCYKENTGVEIKLSLASSAVLARQLESGAPADIVIFASSQWADYAESKHFVINNSRHIVAHNRLVLVASKTSFLQPIQINQQANLPSIIKGKVGIGDPNTVPAGKYCMQSIKYFGWGSAFNGRFINARNVRVALSYAEMNEVTASVIFASDAIKSSRVKIIGSFPQNSHKSIDFISYKVNARTETKELYEYIISEKGMKIWEKHGFLPVKK